MEQQWTEEQLLESSRRRGAAREGAGAGQGAAEAGAEADADGERAAEQYTIKGIEREREWECVMYMLSSIAIYQVRIFALGYSVPLVFSLLSWSRLGSDGRQLVLHPAFPPTLQLTQGGRGKGGEGRK